MAKRTLKKTAAQTTATTNVMDLLVDQLNTLEGIEFTRDAWVNKAPANYGVVELTGEPRQLWADGHLIDSIWQVAVTAYVTGDDDSIADDVGAKLEAMEADGLIDLTYTRSRGFDIETGKVRWVWGVYITGPLTRTEVIPDGETGV